MAAVGRRLPAALLLLLVLLAALIAGVHTQLSQPIVEDRQVDTNTNKFLQRAAHEDRADPARWGLQGGGIDFPEEIDNRPSRGG